MSSRWTEQDVANYREKVWGKMKQRTRKPQVRDSPSRAAKPATDKVESRRDYKADLVQRLTFRGISVEPEFKIFETRRFRADWRVANTKILIEFEGGLFAKGKQGHSSVTGILRDIEKYNLCALGGWIVIRVTPKHVTSGEALIWIETAVDTHHALTAKPSATGAV